MKQPLTPSRAILLGTLAVGIADITFAFVRAMINGNTPGRVLQAIAFGLLGKSTYDGGAATMLLGLVLHFIISAGVVAVYFLASRRVAALTEHPYVCGMVYGLMVFGMMNFVVIPLSAITPGPRVFSKMIPGILIHLFGVGVPAALAARAATRRN